MCVSLEVGGRPGGGRLAAGRPAGRPAGGQVDPRETYWTVHEETGNHT